MTLCMSPHSLHDLWLLTTGTSFINSSAPSNTSMKLIPRRHLVLPTLALAAQVSVLASDNNQTALPFLKAAVPGESKLRPEVDGDVTTLLNLERMGKE